MIFCINQFSQKLHELPPVNACHFNAIEPRLKQIHINESTLIFVETRSVG